MQNGNFVCLMTCFSLRPTERIQSEKPETRKREWHHITHNINYGSQWRNHGNNRNGSGCWETASSGSGCGWDESISERQSTSRSENDWCQYTSMNSVFFRPSATVSRIGLIESCTCRRGGPPPTTGPPQYHHPHPHCWDPPTTITPDPPLPGMRTSWMVGELGLYPDKSYLFKLIIWKRVGAFLSPDSFCVPCANQKL